MAVAVESEQPILAFAAHELRTPLATQRALLELALADPDADVATWREIGEDVLGACRQQERLLEACLTLSRCGSRPRRCQPVDLAEMTAGAIELHAPRGPRSMVALEPAWTTGDPELLERLAVNLISNAVRHNVVGGWIEVATRTEPSWAVLSVVNTGPPVPPEALPRLFQPFQRLTSEPGDGIGLGLAIVEAIAVAHDAGVDARARSGGGLRIDVAFPALD